jgi:hypothetical protein
MERQTNGPTKRGICRKWKDGQMDRERNTHIGNGETEKWTDRERNI